MYILYVFGNISQFIDTRMFFNIGIKPKHPASVRLRVCVHDNEGSVFNHLG